MKVKTRAEVGRYFNKSLRTIDVWISNGAPKADKDGYDLDKISEWRKSRRQPKEANVKKWESKFREMRAKIAEVDLKIKTGKLLDAEKVEAGRCARIREVKLRFLSLPQQLAPQLAGLEAFQIQKIIDDRIREVIAAFAETK